MKTIEEERVGVTSNL